jgi:hypothetical protein
MISVTKCNPNFIYDVTRLINEGKSYHYIEKELKISRPTISTYAKRLGIHQQDRIKLKRYALNLEYFENIDTPEKAYIIGLLYADGCNTRRGLQIALAEEDKEVIEFVKSQLGASNALRFVPAARVTWKNKWELNITSMKLSRQLTAVGIHPDKSLTIKFPSWLSDNLMSHFIRGYFDGDGSIWQSGKSFSVAFSSGSLPFIKELHKVLLDQSGANLNYYKHSSNNGNSIQSSKQETVGKVLTYLYNDSPFSMERKRKKALAFFVRKGGI